MLKEIFWWSIAAARELEVMELKEAVEWSLNDKFPDFKRFLLVEGGSIFHLTERKHTPGLLNVQPVHETLRSFLTNPERRGDEFYVDKSYAHAHVLSACLAVMSSVYDDFKSIVRYGTEHWGDHLANVNESSVETPDIEADIYRFFVHQGCKVWVRDQISTVFNSLKQRQPEHPFLGDVIIYLKRWRTLTDLDIASGYRNEETGSDRLAVSWGLDILSNQWKLGHYVGKASAEIWLYEDLEAERLQTLFWISVKYFLISSRSSSVGTFEGIDDLKDISAGDFGRILEWVGRFGSVPKDKGLGIAFHALRLWNDCIIHLRNALYTEKAYDVRRFLSFAYRNIGDYDGAINALAKNSSNVLEAGCLYRRMGDLERASAVLEKPNFASWDLIRVGALGEAYFANQDQETRKLGGRTQLCTMQRPLWHASKTCQY